VIQYNCARGGQTVEVALETAVRMGADMVLLQEPRMPKEKDSTTHHDSFRWIRGEEGLPAKCWVAISRTTQCRVMERRDLTRECANYVQTLEVHAPGAPPTVIINVYDQTRISDGVWPVNRANWDVIMAYGRLIIAGDMNAHSRLWNARASNTV